MTRWPRPTGRTALRMVILSIGLLILSNVVATVFWHLDGGVGLLDLDGGANLAQPWAAIDLQPPGTPQRTLAILASYGPAARTAHAIILMTLDLAFPPTLALTGWIVAGWASRTWPAAARSAAMLVAGLASSAYLVLDLGENLTELILLAGRSGAAADLLPLLTGAKSQAFAAMAASAVALAAIHGLGRVRARRGSSAGVGAEQP